MTPPIDTLRAWVREDFGLDVMGLVVVGHGADETAELWRGVATDGRAYAVKLSGGGTPAGLVLTGYLAACGVPGVAPPLRAVGGQPWARRGGRRLSVVPWLSDHRALAGGMTRAHWTAYGDLLAAVHATTVTSELAAQLPREVHSHEHTRSAVDELQAALRSPADALASSFVDEWRRDGAGARVSALLEHADRLGPLLRSRDAPAVICHGDPHLGNLLVGEGNSVWLVDWDDAVLAPRERDLMFLLDGVLAFAPVTAEERAWFFDGYGPAHVETDRLAYHRCVRGVLAPTGLVRLALSGAAADAVAPRLERTDDGGHV